MTDSWGCVWDLFAERGFIRRNQTADTKILPPLLRHKSSNSGNTAEHFHNRWQSKQITPTFFFFFLDLILGQSQVWRRGSCLYAGWKSDCKHQTFKSYSPCFCWHNLDQLIKTEAGCRIKLTDCIKLKALNMFLKLSLCFPSDLWIIQTTKKAWKFHGWPGTAFDLNWISMTFVIRERQCIWS